MKHQNVTAYGTEAGEKARAEVDERDEDLVEPHLN